MSRSSLLAHLQLGIITLITIAFLWATMPQPAEAEDMPLCHAVALTGPEHTLNPRAPKAQQLHEKAQVCDFVIRGEGFNKRIEPLPQPLIIPPPPPHIV